MSMSSAPDVTIIIPSMDNPRYLMPCLASILAHTIGVEYRILVVNNGAPWSAEVPHSPRVQVIEAGGNQGWEGGLKLGLRHTTSSMIVFLNDDTLILPGQGGWLQRLLTHFSDPVVAAVGPASNYVAGAQSITLSLPGRLYSARFLVGFCLLIRRDVLEQVGGVRGTGYGGDDIDLSIRLRAAGYTLICDRGVFVYHYGAVTGGRVMGSVWEPDGWYGANTVARGTDALIARYGQSCIDETWRQGPLAPYTPPIGGQ